jgi:hypothetical protein
MSGSGAAVFHSPSAPPNKQLHLFYNTNKKNLGLQIRDETKTSDETEAYVARDGDQNGIVINPAQISTTNMTGVDIVVGFTAKPPPAPGTGVATQNDVSIISPIYQPIAASELNNLTIATTSSPQTAWVFFLT